MVNNGSARERNARRRRRVSRILGAVMREAALDGAQLTVEMDVRTTVGHDDRGRPICVFNPGRSRTVIEQFEEE